MWIDSQECMGAGTCEQIAPEVFHGAGDGTWVVKEDAAFFGATTVIDGFSERGHGPSGAAGIARVPDHLQETVIDAAEACPASASTWRFDQ